MGLQPAAAGTETLTYQFTGTPDALYPDYGLTKGPDGYFYGVTAQGGKLGLGFGNGAIYRLKPPTKGHPAWQESVIWNFQGGAKGKWPSGPLVFGADGTAYGTTLMGGAVADCNQGCGTAYAITPPPPGKKFGTFRIIHDFHHTTGSSPTGGLVFDSQGNLYGATMYGGNDNYCTGDKGGCGVIFKLAPPAAGKVAWVQTTLHQMQHQVGAVPNGGLIFDSTESALYGTTEGGGGTSLRDGVVFSLTKPTPGHTQWGYSMLYNFQGNTTPNTDGSQPYAGLVFDSAGNLYGTTQYGGDEICGNSAGCGVAFKLAKSGNVWTESIVHTFEDGNDGRYPLSALTYDGDSLYGTTSNGGGGDLGCGNGCGTVYRITLTPSPSYAVLHAFQNVATDGIVPKYGSLVLSGNTLYGTTSSGGQPFYGTVFSLTLP